MAKAALPAVRMFTLAVLAGAFIALGAAFATIATTGAEGAIGTARAACSGESSSLSGWCSSSSAAPSCSPVTTCW